ncbi:tRNA(Met)-cytidine N(4)-acetyltransferase [Cricetibacter osteomyelitidis]|uniref:tRNA(Met) cytidine acetyltransferase TmcA n=1 Tax=Cricetibacter osteomyelitidis TaxID=1521931 RepID=A0A4R2T205_9PAST|nr:GNAT family N-acetyltransferase [Cricetibacter osteomyelitidis]TCP96939.1 tRNA(Met)-cytidine N(4)-acetyltransferase [Cricetibacter osteomyelitidis]
MPKLPDRQIYLIENEKLSEILPHFNHSQNTVWIGDISPEFKISYFSFKKAANLLGQEFDCIICDARTALNLEALAIAGGTLKAGGSLFLLVQDWADWEHQTDLDSLRWSGEPQTITTPNFRRYFKEIMSNNRINEPSPVKVKELNRADQKPTQSQQQIITEILKQQFDLYFLTAKRGRGKSALAGLLANQLKAKIYLTAPNKSAVKILQDFAQTQIEFISPDALCGQIRQSPQQFQDCWLFVDEAAMIPLELLHCFCSTFSHILFTTTIHSYEGTGRGFKLKFMQNTHRTSESFELTEPLRWADNDPLEKLIDELLLLDAEDHLPQAELSKKPSKVTALSQTDLINQPVLLHHFYGLLTQAHYRTSPIDLRRLFDAPKQQFWFAQNDNLLGCVWTVIEGGMQDDELISAIPKGTRRPPGNLGSQLLCYQYHLADACRLKSLRVSRIAVLPKLQQNGIGQLLMNQIAKDSQAEYDYLSVSFGYTPELARFWQKCGFNLVHFGEHKEATSGCYPALAVRPLNALGKYLCESAQQQFLRNIPLQNHPLSSQFAAYPIDWQLSAQDMESLQNFADFHRTFAAALPAIRRLIHRYELTNLENMLNKKTNQYYKEWLASLRLEIKDLLNTLLP